ncbi:hypothetical protein Poli38472_004447 [Pythium oligandrum]|uniref:Cytochrome b561 domain-containing protein n=1 Tax=Pythium oligandrum TaxID=41045 RepID=A0A8K1CB04_PYTOL|nr:hypothetical protein Poli38472_004447 [Pythium oligandrum]|eukprot:TMW59378.1 hypothetical protein Poli38472_004447 [Pythium oligandrum]
MEVNKREVFVLVALFGAPCALILAECVRDSSLFAVHPAMNALANLICTPAALYLMLERKRVRKRQTRVLLTKLHLALHVLAAVLMTVGGVAIFQVKKSFGKRHLTSIHSWAGLSMSLFFLLNILQGLLLTFEKKPSNWQWKDETHGLVGTIVYITSVVTMGYGLYSGSWGVDHFGVQRQQHLLILLGLAHVVMLGKAIVASRPAPSKAKSS